MNNSYMFGVGRGAVSRAEEKRIRAAIKKAGYGPDQGRDQVHFIAANMPGEGHKFWFSGPNYGAGIDDRMARAVMAVVGAVRVKG